MPGLLRAIPIAATLAVALATPPARADEIAPAVRDSMQAIIAQQIDAFSRDDAQTAESFAAPGIRARFPDPKDFVAMVRQSYAPLFKPQSTRFEKAGSTALGPIQSVTIVDREGNAWSALYTFEDVEGAWRINGCVLIKQDSTAV